MSAAKIIILYSHIYIIMCYQHFIRKIKYFRYFRQEETYPKFCAYKADGRARAREGSTSTALHGFNQKIASVTQVRIFT